MYRFLGVGEYHLLVSRNGFEVQGRMVTCFDASSCFNSIAAKIAGSTVMIHGRFTSSGEPSVYVNGKQTYSLEQNVGHPSEGFVLRRVSSLKFILETFRGVRLEVRLYDRYLDVHFEAKNKTYCESTGGLWGSCNGKLSDDFSSRTQFFKSTFNNIIPGEAYIHEVFGPSWKVAMANSLFVYDTNQYQEKRGLDGGGYALLFNNTGVQTSELYSITSSDISIEFMMKLIGGSGTVISYTTTKTFALTLSSGNVKLHYGETVLDTLVTIQTNKWVHITLVWSKASKILQFYLIDEGGIVSSRNFPISSEVNVFEPGGVLALGYWRPSPLGRGHGPTQGFIGILDELRIWNKKLDPGTVVSHWRMNLNCRYSTTLASLWKFNEGQGSVAKDCVSQAHITIPSSIWRPPTWVYSTAPIHFFSVDIRRAYSLRFEMMIPLTAVQKKCKEIILDSELKASYPNLNASLLSFYYSSCIFTVSRTGYFESAYWILLGAADYGLILNPSKPWYAKKLCNAVAPNNFPEWVGPKCQTFCKYGSRTSRPSKLCECDYGFYGGNCTRECPGGFKTPCNGLSTCDPDTGKCTCPLTANASNDCTKCENGWFGKDCSVSADKVTSRNVSYCAGFGVGHYTTFDGAGFDFRVAGEFYVLNTQSLVVQMRQIPYGNDSVCMTSVAVKAGRDIVTIRASLSSKGSPLVWINRKLTNATKAQLDNGFSFHKRTPRTYVIRNNKTSAGPTQVKVTTWKKCLSFEVISPTDICRVETGLCASCDGNAHNDFKGVNNTVLWDKNATYAAIAQLLSSRWNVESSQSMFVYGVSPYYEKRTINALGYCLVFNGSVANSMSTTFNMASDLTLQFFVKINNIGGTMISYATRRTVAIVNDATVKVYIGTNTYDVGEALEMDTWYQITLVYQRTAGICYKYFTKY